MNQGLIVVRYAKALYELAMSEKQEKAVLSDIKTLDNLVVSSEEFKGFLENPLLKVGDKARIIDKLFNGKLNPLTLRFLHLLLENKRELYLREICLQVIRLNKTSEGISEALITTAQPLSDEHRKEISEYLTRRFKAKVEISEKVNPEIIGGFVLRIEDQQINASLQHQLKKIQRELINS